MEGCVPWFCMVCTLTNLFLLFDSLLILIVHTFYHNYKLAAGSMLLPAPCSVINVQEHLVLHAWIVRPQSRRYHQGNANFVKRSRFRSISTAQRRATCCMPPRVADNHNTTSRARPSKKQQGLPKRNPKSNVTHPSVQCYRKNRTALTTRLRLNKQRCRMAEVGRGATATHYSMLSTSLASSSSRYFQQLGQNGCNFERSLIVPPPVPIILLKGPCNRRAGVSAK